MRGKNLRAKINNVVQYIRRRAGGEGAVSMEEICWELNLSIATMYNYAKFITTYFDDIEFRDKMFYVHSSQKSSPSHSHKEKEKGEEKKEVITE